MAAQHPNMFASADLGHYVWPPVSVDEYTADLLTINTMKGLYRVRRLPFGIKCATAVFQRLMETLLAGIEGVAVLLDVILIMGATAEQHWQRVNQVLGRLPLKVTEVQVPTAGDVLMLEALPDPPIEAARIPALTEADPVLGAVKKYCGGGWPQSGAVADELRPYWTRWDELSLYKGCILWVSRVVIPSALRQELLVVLHAAHNGVVKSKAIARSYMWWPKMDDDIERMIGLCQKCQQSRANSPQRVLASWEPETKPWARVHIDFFGPFQGKVFLLAVDAYSKWPEVRIVRSASSACVVHELRDIFSIQGIPECLVSDNGSAFVSSELGVFARKNGIWVVRTIPFHPSSNGQVERMVQTVKGKLKKGGMGDWQTRLARTLFALRTTPVTGSHKTPADLLMGRALRTALDLIQPNPSKSPSVQPAAERHSRHFKAGDTVWYRAYYRNAKWLPGTVLSAQGHQIFIVKDDIGGEHRRHKDQIRHRVPRGSAETDGHLPARGGPNEAIEKCAAVQVPPRGEQPKGEHGTCSTHDRRQQTAVEDTASCEDDTKPFRGFKTIETIGSGTSYVEQLIQPSIERDPASICIRGGPALGEPITEWEHKGASDSGSDSARLAQDPEPSESDQAAGARPYPQRISHRPKKWEDYVLYH
ncbi:uncharacterized protein K02A2.6-like [Bacillus rossius redtenbacheri]|uniref:uncharacterized protein K02A2.6-like n=1 Tax=Bacillus rossius redtenbacheri TaxID=93214 RepID=UPI002FDE90AE